MSYSEHLPVDGQPGVRGSPSPIYVVPRCMPEPGSHLVFGYTSSGATPSSATSSGSENRIIPTAPRSWACTTYREGGSMGVKNRRKDDDAVKGED